MPKYLVRVSYTAEGVKGLLREGGTSRREMVEKLAASVGGRMESFYYAFGEDDVVTIVEAPDHASVAAISLAAGASGAVNINTTVLIEPEVIDEAVKRTVDYRAPGA